MTSNKLSNENSDVTKDAPKKRFPMPIWAIVGALVVVAIVILAIVAGQKGNTIDPDSSEAHNHGGSDAAEPAAEQHVETNLVRRDANDVASLGDIDAPIVLIEYSDYRCPFCAVVAKDIFPELIETYVDTGQMRIEWRDMPVKGDESVLAAQAARAAGLQGKFWEFNETVYQASPDKGLVEISEAKLIEYATNAGVADLDKFVIDMNSIQFDDQIYRDLMEARSINASGTPTFILGNQLIPGAQPIEVFHQIIQAELAKAELGVILAQ